MKRDLTDSIDDIIRKIKEAVTDSEVVGLTDDEEKRKGLANLFAYYGYFMHINHHYVMDSYLKLYYLSINYGI